MVLLRNSRENEIDRIMTILAEGRSALAALGIDQWQGGYPHRQVIESDIAQATSYVLEDEDGKLIATAMIGFEGEKDYLTIEDGQWLTSSDMDNPCYAVVHRVAVSTSNQRRGAASFLLAQAELIAAQAGCASVRIDTHPGNVRMRGLLEKSGYERCGIIHIAHAEESTPERIAYEKFVSA